MALIASFFLAFIPALIYAGITYWMDRYEKEPKLMIGGVFIWGAVIAAGGAYILNTIFGIAVFVATSDELVTNIATGSFSAPLVEESLKGLAVLIVFLVFRKEFDSILDGIVYAGITALGFAATENVLYMYQQGYMEAGWDGLWFLFFIRVILGAWNHATYTAFTGIGLAVARMSRSGFVKFFAPIVGLGTAMFVHFLHNTLAIFAEAEWGLAMLFVVDWLGWLFIFFILVWAISRERKWIKFQLQDEVRSGLISPAQYQIATSPLKRNLATLGGLGKGSYNDTRRFYQLCAELAHKKQQIGKIGTTTANTVQMVESLRAELAQLAPRAAV